jgi:hypothetical protein
MPRLLTVLLLVASLASHAVAGADARSFIDEEIAAHTRSIKTDMLSGNSWSAATNEPDQYASRAKRWHASFWQLLPIKPLL